jgi:hypothetical protein
VRRGAGRCEAGDPAGIGLHDEWTQDDLVEPDTGVDCRDADDEEPDGFRPRPLGGGPGHDAVVDERRARPRIGSPVVNCVDTAVVHDVADGPV